MRFRSAVAVVIAVALIPSTVLACAWDYDTLKMERQRFPTTLELITGKFLRHSKEFYEWRIRDRQARLAADPSNLSLHDDLGVAYDKTGQHEKAIETMRAADKLRSGRYETEANLGTFLIHSGRLEEGLVHIDNAISINPDAHFGREKYQKYLTEYILERRKDGKIPQPLATGEEGFAEFLRKRTTGTPFTQEQPAAVKGVLGMMRFARYDSPVLLEALGSLLIDMNTYPSPDAKRLAARAYLKASYEVTDKTACQGYRRLATVALNMQTVHPGTSAQLGLEQIEAEFQKELAEAREWYAELREKELGWIRDGKNPDEEFDKLYDQEPEVTWAEEERHLPIRYQHGLLIALGLVLLALLMLSPFIVVYLIRRSRRRHAS